MHDEIVSKRRWVGERRFLHALNYCMLLPGPEAQQLATYLGWLLRGPSGGLFAGSLFILPGFLSIMALSVLFAVYGNVGWVSGLFFGVTAAVLAVVAGAVAKIGKRVIKNQAMFSLAAGSFVAIFVFSVPFPIIVAAAATIGWVGGRLRPDAFDVASRHAGDVDQPGALIADDGRPLGSPTMRRALGVVAVGLALWFGPILGLWLVDRESVFVDIGWFFSTAALLTFGGAYSVLAYISHAAVEVFGWLQPGEMLSGLGMAETTPGPLIQVVQFVGFMGPFRDPGSFSALHAGIFGAVVATWATFVPSFLWIFLGAPFMENLRGRPALTSALSSVTAAVVGVVMNLAVWFGLYTLFSAVVVHRLGPLTVYEPNLMSLDPVALAIAVAAGLGVFVLKRPTFQIVAAGATAGIIHQLLVS